MSPLNVSGETADVETQAPEAAAQKSSAPKAPKDESLGELGFVRQPMVQWFSLPQLINTGVKVVLSSIFGSYEDKREIQAMLPVTAPPDYSNEDSIDIDYMADTGDGFDSTYTMARFAAKKQLRIQSPQGQITRPRGRILVLGGDQVYPTASQEAYRDRLVGPFRSALPWVESEDEAPHLYAIPGNHDWYDGLTGFIRLFCQNRWMGGWKTKQQRSYFAIKLPHGWWLWGTDIQLDSDVDQPQITFFQNLARDHMQKGDKVILCTAEPSWAHQWLRDGSAFGNLGYLERTLIREPGFTLPLVLSGDLHHYSRYQRADASMQRITAGGGGAFLHSTAGLPASGTLAEGGNADVTYNRKAEYPSKNRSRAISARALGFPLRGKSYAAMIGFIYLLIAWSLEKGSARLGLSLLQEIASGKRGPLGGILTALASGFKQLPLIALDSPGLIMTLLYLFGVAYYLCDEKKAAFKFARSGALWLTHVTCALLLTGLVGGIETGWLHLSVGSQLQTSLFSLLIFAIGSIVGGMLMGVYLALCAAFGRQLGDAFSSMGIADYKNMLKLNIDSAGRLTVCAVGVDTVGKAWTLNPQAKPGEAWFKAGTSLANTGAEEALDKTPTLIDVPVRFDPATGKWNDVTDIAG